MTLLFSHFFCDIKFGNRFPYPCQTFIKCPPKNTEITGLMLQPFLFDIISTRHGLVHRKLSLENNFLVYLLNDFQRTHITNVTVMGLKRVVRFFEETFWHI